MEIYFCKEVKNCLYLYLFCLFDVLFVIDLKDRDMKVDSVEVYFKINIVVLKL